MIKNNSALHKEAKGKEANVKEYLIKTWNKSHRIDPPLVHITETIPVYSLKLIGDVFPEEKQPML